MNRWRQYVAKGQRHSLTFFKVTEILPLLTLPHTFFEATGPIEAILYGGRTNVCSGCFGHMVKIAAMPIYGESAFRSVLQQH